MSQWSNRLNTKIEGHSPGLRGMPFLFCCRKPGSLGQSLIPCSLRGSDIIGYAVNAAVRGNGMLEYWNVGMLGLVE